MITNTPVLLGCDPELFIETSDGEVVGSEKVIEVGYFTGIVRDGVQVELNPAPSSCRETVAMTIASLVNSLSLHVERQGRKLSFKSVVEVSKKELDSLSEESKRLGCAPSLNIYDSKATVKVSDDYRTRCGGGHLHFGFQDSRQCTKTREMVQCLDSILGSTCVLLDRNPAMKERRKVYGRAGEHRLPPHGLEYRTLSNFWMRSYQLWSFVAGLGRMAVSAAMSPDAYKDLISSMDASKVAAAINENDFDLAWENWEVLKKWLVEHAKYPVYGGYPNEYSNANHPHARPLCEEKLVDFEFFVHKGLDYWFKEDPVNHWRNFGYSGRGWESFITGIVHSERLKEEAKRV